MRVEPKIFFPGQPVQRINTNSLPVDIYQPSFGRMILEEESVSSCFTTNRFSEIIPVLFENDTTLFETLKIIENGQLLPYSKLETVNEHQLGRNGVIRIFQACTEDGHTTPFVVHISRFPTENLRLEKEYKNLKYLSSLFETHLDEDTRTRFNVVKPLQFGVSGELDSCPYPFFTMPYIPQGELNQQYYIHEDSSNGKLLAIPHFIYAIPYNETMFEVNRRQLTDTHLNVQERIETHKKLCHDLLIVNALIYHLTGGRMLNDMKINAGDFMADMSNFSQGMPLTLVAIQNGLTDPVSLQEWVANMQGHTELSETHIAGFRDKEVYTFFNFPDIFFYKALLEANGLVKR